MDNSTVSLIEQAIESGTFDKKISLAINILLSEFKSLRRKNLILYQILNHLNIDEEWENAAGDPVKPLFDLLER